MGIGLLCYVLVTLFAKQPAISASQLELNNPGIAVIAGLLGLAGGLLPRLIWRCSKLKEKLNPHRKWELHAVTAVASFLGSFSLLAYLSWDGWHQAILSAYCGLFAGFAVSSIIARCLDLAKTS